MEALSILKFWRSQTAVVADDGLEAAIANTTTTTDEDEATDEEDSFFDLVFEPPSNKYYHLAEGTKTSNLSTQHDDDSIKPSSSPVTTLRFPSVSMPRSFALSFKKSSKNNGDSSVPERSSRGLASRDNSLRSKMMSENIGTTADQTASVSGYFRLIKPLVSKKGRVTEILTPFASPVCSSTRKLAQSGRVGSFKISINVGRNSWKGRSATATAPGAEEVPRRRDESLLEQQSDGIQGAILHCKRSYSSSSSSSQESSQLIRSASDPSHDKILLQGRYSCEEKKRCSI